MSISSIPGWLKLATDGYIDASSYALVADQVNALNAIIQQNQEIIAKHLSKIAALESQIMVLRAELNAKFDDSPKHEEKSRHSQQVEQFDLLSEIIHESYEAEDYYIEGPRYPQCLRCIDNIRRALATCSRRNYIVGKQRETEVLFMALENTALKSGITSAKDLPKQEATAAPDKTNASHQP